MTSPVAAGGARLRPPMNARLRLWYLHICLRDLAHHCRTFITVDDLTVADGEEVMSKALECLAAIQGSFAFVIYDSGRHRVLAGGAAFCVSLLSAYAATFSGA